MAELGRFALLAGLFLSGYAILVDLLGGWRKDKGLRILCSFYSLYKFLWHTHSSNITSHIVRYSG